ncbi:hypothetical protein DFH28DRAFT_1199648 [Melampsora americana]|nr:hypothetical protein DFH28DRAFT_1199648 [Melampsora americana]
MPKNTHADRHLCHHRHRSPTPSTDMETDDDTSRLQKKKQSKSKSSSRHKAKKATVKKTNGLPNQNYLETVDTSEIKELINPIHLHICILMRRLDATSPIPPPPTPSEKLALENKYAEAEYPDNLSPFLLPHNPLLRITNRISDTFYKTLEMSLQRWGLTRYTFDWDGNFDDAFNQISLQFFLKTFVLAVDTLEYGIKPSRKFRDSTQLSAVVFRAFKSLRAGYKAQVENPLILKDRYEATEARKEQESRLTECRNFLKASGVCRKIASIFRRKKFMIMGDVEVVEIKASGRLQKERRVYYPQWWSETMIIFMKFLEYNIHFNSQLVIKTRGAKRTPITYVPSLVEDFHDVPEGLPSDIYSREFKSMLLPALLHRYNRIPPCLPTIEQDMKRIFPQPDEMIVYDSDDSLASLSDEDSQSAQSKQGDTTEKSDHSEIDIDIPSSNLSRHNNNQVYDTNKGKEVVLHSDIDLISKSPLDPIPSDALTVYRSSEANTNINLPSDPGPSLSNEQGPIWTEELAIALKTQQDIMDKQMSQLSMRYEAEFNKRLEAEKNVMKEAIEKEKRELMMTIEKEVSAEQQRLITAKQQIALQIEACREEFNTEKEKISAEKQHIEAVVLAEEERILAEKDFINKAVVVERERLEAERLQLQIEHQAIAQGHQFQSALSSSQAQNHVYPPN